MRAQTTTDYFLHWADVFDPWIEALKGPAYQWPTITRRAYVMTWPVSMILRGVAIGVLIFAWLVVGACGYIANRLACIWRGQRSMWGD